MDNSDSRQGLPSASSFERLVRCPGSWLLESSTPKHDNALGISQEGTQIHKALSDEDMSELGLTAERVAHRLKMIEEAAIVDWSSQFNLSDFRVMREVPDPGGRYWITDHGTHKEVCSCKPDLFAYTSGHLLVIDFKSGFLPAEPSPKNWQLKIQLTALDQSFGPFGSIRAAIAQSRLGDTYDKCDYTRDDIDQVYLEVLFYLGRSRETGHELVPGDHCRYCRARADCEPFAAYGLLPWARARFDRPMAKKDIYAKVGQLSLKDLAFIESRRSAGANLFEAVKARLKTLDDKTLASLGYELKSAGVLRSVTGLDELWEILRLEDLCSDKEFREMCKISLGKLEELVVTRIKLKNQIGTEAAQAIFNSLIAPVVKQTPKEKSLNPLVSVLTVGTRP